MKKFLVIIFFILFLSVPNMAKSNDTICNATVEVYANETSTAFGLKCKNGEIITDTKFTKLIRLSDHSWIAMDRKKYGIIDANGEYLIKPKYRHAERFFGKYAKLGNTNDYGLYDADGNIVIPPEYKKIETLFGKMFLTYKNYKYGVISMDGRVLLDNKFDDIYMPDFQTMRVKYRGEWFEMKKANGEVVVDDNVFIITKDDEKLTLTDAMINSGIWSGYSALTFTDYITKIISSISPAYEDTIDELMLSHGTDTVSIFMNFGWIIKFPATYAQKYYSNLITPNNGPLSEIRENVKKQIK